VKPQGILFVEDYQLPSIARAVSFFTTNLEWEIEEVSSDGDLHHWAVIRTAKRPPKRPFDHFIDF
jgi:hypothetical protein